MSSAKSGVWEYFERDSNGQSARCKLCHPKTSLKTVGGSTKGLHTHLQTKHKISVLKKKSDGNVGGIGAAAVPNTGSEEKASCTASAVDGPLNKYVLYDFDRTLGATVSRMTARDGLPFRVFATSPDMRKAMAALGFTNLPKTANSIQKIVMEHGQKVRSFVTSEIVQRKTAGERFTLTFDEWTSTRNRRYMVVNVHALGGVFWSLGLVRVHGSMPAEKCVELLEMKLKEFNISLSEDIVCICTDGASVMKKVGKLVEAEQQLCYAHGIQLAVLDVLYKPKAQPADAASISTNSEEPDIVASACEEDEDCDGDTLEVIDDDIDVTAELSEEYHQVIDKVRKVVRLFRKSPTKNDAVLQTYVIREIGHEMTAILDCRTRWSSLTDMLSRFQTLKNPIQKALIDLKEPVRLTESDFITIQDLVSSLEPIKLAVSALCRRDINLITAEAALQFCLMQLKKQSSELARTLAIKLESRIQERRELHAGVLQYLHNPDTTSTDTFAIPSSGTIRKFLQSLLMRLGAVTG